MKGRLAPPLLFPIWLCAFAGCGTELTAAGQRVRFGKAEPRVACRELGIVLGSGQGGNSAANIEWAQNELRNRTAEKGGNYVAMDVVSGGDNHVTLSGRAYRCPSGGPSRPEVAEPWQRLHSVDFSGPPIKAPDSSAATSPERPRQTPSAPSGLSPEERLIRLRSLMDKGLITQQEYDSRRREILQSL